MEVHRKGFISARGNHESENPPASAAGASDVQAPTPLPPTLNLRDSIESLHIVDQEDAVESESSLKTAAHQVQSLTEDAGSVGKETKMTMMHVSSKSPTKSTSSLGNDDCVIIETPKLSRQARRRQNKKLRIVEDKFRKIQVSSSVAPTSDSIMHNTSNSSTQTIICTANLVETPKLSKRATKRLAKKQKTQSKLSTTVQAVSDVSPVCEGGKRPRQDTTISSMECLSAETAVPLRKRKLKKMKLSDSKSVESSVNNTRDPCCSRTILPIVPSNLSGSVVSPQNTFSGVLKKATEHCIVANNKDGKLSKQQISHVYSLARRQTLQKPNIPGKCSEMNMNTVCKPFVIPMRNDDFVYSN